jgi:hypothetical protein
MIGNPRVASVEEGAPDPTATSVSSLLGGTAFTADVLALLATGVRGGFSLIGARQARKARRGLARTFGPTFRQSGSSRHLMEAS